MSATTKRYCTSTDVPTTPTASMLFAPTSDKIRVFSFKISASAICIDFTWHPVEPGWLYVVPAHHRIYMPSSLWKGCVCHELDQVALPEEVQMRLFRLHFALKKRVPACGTCDVGALETLAKATGVLPVAAYVQQPHLVYKASSLLHYHELAASFLHLIAQQPPSQRYRVVADLAAELYQHERTLRRASLETFGVAPAQVLRYHLVLAAVQLLAETSLRMEVIADRLEFSGSNKFTRFLKGSLGICPTEFRRLITLQAESTVTPEIVQKW